LRGWTLTFSNTGASWKPRGAPGGRHARFAERLAAAAEEHLRRRNDQIHRHEIFVTPHLDALLWIAEPA
jgi:hypothetical protein